MSAVKISRFLGTGPKTSAELLPDMGAQIARECKLYSGDLIPYYAPVAVGATGRTGVIKTLHGLRDPDTGVLSFLSWITDVNVVSPASDDLDEQRFYFTGDGAPKVSTYLMATTGVAPYPVDAYDLGLPLPVATPVSAATAFTQATSATWGRDGSNNITLTTAAAHNLKSGALATISGFSYRTGTYSQTGTTITVTITGHGVTTGESIYLEFSSGTAQTNSYVITSTGADTFTATSLVSATTSGDVRWDVRDLNITTEVTVVDSTTLTYYSAGPEVATTTSADGKVDLGGRIQSRSYLYTWYTPWQEESIGSLPSDALFIKEGQIVTITGLPTAPPAGDNYIRGMRIYRTISSTTEAEYFRLATLWFPMPVATTTRAADVVTVVLTTPHTLLEGDRFKLSGATVSSFDITGGVVLTVPDQYTFTYAQVGAAVSDAAGTAMVYQDVAESDEVPARYWGDGGDYSFVDDFNYRSLLNILVSNEYDAPPADLKGLTIIQNNIMAGFVGNDIYFSEPNKFHAWPEKYKISIEHNVVALSAVAGKLLVLTEAYPYVVDGSNPETMTTARVDARYPCLNASSVANMGYGVLYATHEGIALYSGSQGAQIITESIHSADTWNRDVSPATVVAVMYNDAYFASHSTGSFLFARDEKVGGHFVDSQYVFTATWYDAVNNNLYYTTGTDGNVVLWDDSSQPNVTYQWKSKVMVINNYTNFGAARVIADYAGSEFSPLWGVLDETWGLTEVEWNTVEPITFYLWANKELVLTTTLSDDGIFRLPSGYMSDTYEVGVDGAIRVRAIHLGETPTTLGRI